MTVHSFRVVRIISRGQAYTWGDRFALLLDLTKIRISLLATLTTATGYLLAAGRITLHVLVPATAVFLLACGSCALNQYQEREIDRLMERTKLRPIPSGRLNPETALWISMGLVFSGCLILLCGTTFRGLILGLLAILWYNLVYTPLKQKTRFAAVPGALVGAIPPALGWVTGGGSMFDPRIWGVSLFFLIWQIPHFWLLLFDISKDYEKAGLPSLTQLFSTQQMKKIIFVWLLSTGVVGLSFPLFGLIHFDSVYACLLAVTLWFSWNAIYFLRLSSHKTTFRIVFMNLNVYALALLFLLSMDRLLSP